MFYSRYLCIFITKVDRRISIPSYCTSNMSIWGNHGHFRGAISDVSINVRHYPILFQIYFLIVSNNTLRFQITMVRNYEKRTQRNSWEPSAVQRAITEISEGKITLRGAAAEYGIPKSTLFDRMKANNFSAPVSGRKPVFSFDMEQKLKEYAIEMCDSFYGLTPISLRKLAFDFAEENKLCHPFDKEKRIAGPDWLYSFLKRNPDLSIRQPEATSLNRIKGFNREEVSIFFSHYRKILTDNNIPSSRIFNIDETGFSTVQRPCKIIARKGQKQVGRAVSGERGITTTVIMGVSASGSYVPPMFVFARKIRDDTLMYGAPNGSNYEISDSGWSNESIFLKWLEQFVTFSGASRENKVILILDNHSSHCSLEAWNFCRNKGVIMLSLPPHSSHRMQPLDLTIFGPLKKAFYVECDTEMDITKKNAIQVKHLVAIFARAFARVANVEKAINGFRAAGIVPFNSEIFSEEDFLPEDRIKTPSCNSDETVENTVMTPSTSEMQQASHSPRVDKDDQLLFDSSTSGSGLFQKVKLLSTGKNHPRKMHAQILTSTPKKSDLEAKQRRKEKRLELKGKRKIEFDVSDNHIPAKTKKVKSNKVIKRGASRLVHADGGAIEKYWFCLYCNEKFVHPPKEDWIQCGKCENWCHEACALKRSLKKAFICAQCMSDVF